MPPIPSYILDGISYNESEVATSGLTVIFTNERTGETQQTTSGGGGVFVFDLANFPSGWINGDVISFTVGGNATKGEYIKYKAISTGGSQLKYVKLKVEEST